MSKKQAPKRGAKRAKNAATERVRAPSKDLVDGQGTALDPKRGLMPPWQPGQSGNPGGMPKGYVSFHDAYVRISTLPPGQIETIAEGGFPDGWRHARSVQYQVAARAYLKMLKESTPALLDHVADRSDGKVPQTVRATVDVQGIIVLPAGPQGLAWGNVVDTHLIDAPARAALPESASDSSDES